MTTINMDTVTNAYMVRTFDFAPRGLDESFQGLRRERMADLMQWADEHDLYATIYAARERLLTRDDLKVGQIIVLYAITRSAQIEAAFDADITALLATELRGDAFRKEEAKILKRRRYARRKLNEQTGRKWDTEYWADYASRWH